MNLGIPDPSSSYRTADIARGDADSLLAAKAECPADDLFSELAVARRAGRLWESETVGTASLIVVAGYETTVRFLSTSAVTLLMAPRLRQLPMQQPELFQPELGIGAIVATGLPTCDQSASDSTDTSAELDEALGCDPLNL
jgi:cytochrome P450